jgi:two-component system nitrate/nitrite response regulator NarL
MRKVRVTIIDDHRIFAEGVADILQNSQMYEVVEIINAFEEITFRVASNPPDVVLLDLNIRGRKSLELISKLKEINSGLAVLVLSMYDEPAFINEAKASGARGYVLKDSGRFELLASLEQILLDPHSFVYKGKETIKKHEDFGSDLFVKGQMLSKREMDVIELLSEDKSYKEIASVLNLSELTVKTHIRNIRQKLEVKSKSGIVRFYYEMKVKDKS